jgi:outer membrane protein OmpA-like peptidoglycan-associated protein
MGSLLESIQNSVSPDSLRSIAATAGESAEGFKQAIEIAAATILASLGHKANDSGFLNQVISLVNSYGTQTLSAAAGAGSAATAAASEASAGFLNLTFGAHKAAVEAKISQSAGMSALSGAAVLSATAPLVLSTLATKTSAGATGLAIALTSELPSLRSLVPAGIPGAQFPNLAGGVAARAAAADKARGGWLWPVLLLGAVLIGGLVWYFNRDTANLAESVETAAVSTKEDAATASSAVSDATKAAWARLGDLFKRKLPDGTELNIPRLGVENKLIDWIESPNPVDKTTWFDFDRLLFSTGAATLEPSSQEQLSNVAAILKAYPKVQIKLGAYTDDTGDAAANLQLSDQRAKNVMAELVKLGVEPSRLEAEGYGEEHPVADNKTEEGRQLNRRISLRVTAK